MDMKKKKVETPAGRMDVPKTIRLVITQSIAVER